LCTGLDVSPRTTTRGWSSSSLPPPLPVKQSLFQQKKTNHLFTKLLVQKNHCFKKLLVSKNESLFKKITVVQKIT
jgi:hypothetical protein